MKVFLDTANVDEIREAVSWGVVDGVTTNPTLILKSGRDFEQVIKEICEIVDGPVSAECVEEKAEAMIAEARHLKKLHKNVIIKIPMTTEGLKAIKVLSREGIVINTTLVFSANQALLAAKAGASYVSPFIGRLDDISEDGMLLIRDIVRVFRNYDFKCKVLAASIRHPVHVLECAKAGADVATLPFEVLKKMARHSLTDAGIKRFLEDWEKAKAFGNPSRITDSAGFAKPNVLQKSLQNEPSAKHAKK
ncbi:MAG: fructose-6-phosphate aldolase [Candidatus Diapherotrites archaeon]|nr:fructose-6-phosphate aldolase [Candidatus Diapherotrites archaeon]